MPNRPWKMFEREVAKLVRGKRFWANSGEKADVRSPIFEVQCKNVQSLSLTEVERILDDMGKQRESFVPTEGRDWLGLYDLVAVKLRRGNGVKSRTLIIMDSTTLDKLLIGLTGKIES